MTKDSLARRLRFAPPNPRDDEVIYPQAADIEQWAAISRHGPLPITYLAHFCARTSRANLQRRYLKFYQLGWLVRPQRQYASFHARYSPLIYDLGSKAKTDLGSRACSLPASRSAPFVHQLMQACVTASLELLAPAKGLTFEGRDKFAAGSLALQLSIGKLVPDDIFALRREDGKRRHFALEIDRNTESIQGTAAGPNTWKRKIDAYDELFRRELHKQWGFPRCSVLVVTTNATHAMNLKAFVAGNSAHPDRFLFAVEEAFGANWRAPRDLLRTIDQLPL
jgi:hypothetical protein